MTVKPSTTGITPVDFRTYDRDPTLRTERYVGSREEESAAAVLRKNGIAVPAPNPRLSTLAPTGRKVSGGANLSGGSI